MSRIPVIAIFDVGKTNKKLFLFDEQYKIQYEESKQFGEIKDEDGFPCEDVHALREWVKDSFDALTKEEKFDIKGVNFSAYGASFVYVDREGKVIAPLYNYLKPYPEKLKHQFYQSYGGENLFAKQTASPVLCSLNSGMQLYRIKNEKPELFKRIAFAFHLPQYLSYILTDYPATDITSIGCHTNLWNFNEQKYHRWVIEEKVENCFAPILPCSTCIPFVYSNKNLIAGLGLHDSSAALIPYLTSFTEPFILLSTGTWCITLNPFNHSQLSDDELRQDCLCYLSYLGKPVKASRLFAGNEHEQQAIKISAFFNKPLDYYKTVQYDFNILQKIKSEKNIPQKAGNDSLVKQSAFNARDLSLFVSYEEAYHQLIVDIISQQVHSTRLVLQGTSVKRIFVDGGFSKNQIFMHLLSDAFPGIEVYAASVPQASAIGAAFAIHQHWNSKPRPSDIIDIKQYRNTQAVSL
jgi:sugar (pentulose or hexulose) kinase